MVCLLSQAGQLARDLSRKPTQRAPPHNPLRHAFCSLTSSHGSCVSCNLFLGKSPLSQPIDPQGGEAVNRAPGIHVYGWVSVTYKGQPVPHRKQKRAAYPALSTHEPGQAEALSDHSAAAGGGVGCRMEECLASSPQGKGESTQQSANSQAPSWESNERQGHEQGPFCCLCLPDSRVL